MTYCFKCPQCGLITEQTDRENAPNCFGDTRDEALIHDPVLTTRDYQSENALIDKFSLRQDVRGNRRHRADVMSSDDAHKLNQSRMS